LRFLACSYFLDFSDESGVAIAHLFFAICASKQRFAIAFVQTP
jgi:hypothetical protein